MQIRTQRLPEVDLDMLNMFAVSTYHLSLIVFEIKDEKY
jgi:hypothetical protein